MAKAWFNFEDMSFPSSQKGNFRVVISKSGKNLALERKSDGAWYHNEAIAEATSVANGGAYVYTEGTTASTPKGFNGTGSINWRDDGWLFLDADAVKAMNASLSAGKAFTIDIYDVDNEPSKGTSGNAQANTASSSSSSSSSVPKTEADYESAAMENFFASMGWVAVFYEGNNLKHFPEQTGLAFSYDRATNSFMGKFNYDVNKPQPKVFTGYAAIIPNTTDFIELQNVGAVGSGQPPYAYIRVNKAWWNQFQVLMSETNAELAIQGSPPPTVAVSEADTGALEKGTGGGGGINPLIVVGILAAVGIGAVVVVQAKKKRKA